MYTPQNESISVYVTTLCQTLRSSEQHFCFVVGNPVVQIPARTPATVVKILYGFTHSLEANCLEKPRSIS
jgi:hypothetical protein